LERKKGDFGGVLSSVIFWKKKAKNLYHKIKKKKKKPLEKNRKFPWIGKNGPKSSQKQGIYFL